MGGKSSDAPSAPDFTALAREQGRLNERALAQQVGANRPAQVTPWGEMTWASERGIDPATGAPITEWTQTQSLDPRLQAQLESEFDVGQARGDVARTVAGRLAGDYGAPLDYSQFRGVPEVERAKALRNRAEEAVYGRMTSRLDPRFEEEAERLEITLRNRGLRPGDEAYEAEMDRFNRAKTDAYQTAMQESVTGGRAEAGQIFNQQMAQQAQAAALRDREIAEALQQRGMSLAEVNALLGRNVAAPATPGFAAAGRATPADVMGAGMSQYNAAVNQYSADQAARQGLLSGIASTGLGLLGMFSDHRLKKLIRCIGRTVFGEPIYTFEYINGVKAVGVMAHDVPHAAFEHESGFAVVDYARV